MTVIDALIAGNAVAPIRTGESGATVVRLSAPDAGTRYLKTGIGSIGADIAAESVRLAWLAGRVAAPALLASGSDGAVTYQLSAALDGESAYAALERDPSRRVQIVASIAQFLRTLHAMPIADCPFDASHERRLIDARRNIDAGRVDADDFDDVRAGWTPEQVWEALQSMCPLHTEPVLTHGDFSLDNIFVRDGQVTGMLDVGRLGVADRYQDLAVLSNCLGEFGGTLPRTFFETYGLVTVDDRRLDFHLLLDELF